MVIRDFSRPSAPAGTLIIAPLAQENLLGPATYTPAPVN